MTTTEVRCCIIVGIVLFKVTTMLAICEEILVIGGINANPNLSYAGVSALLMTTKLMFTFEAVRLLVALVTLELLMSLGFWRHLGDGDLLALC